MVLEPRAAVALPKELTAESSAERAKPSDKPTRLQKRRMKKD
jgi:hypothetical protein